MSEYPTYLIHYGIEGQKWGVRRFQNEDGTYTSEGLERRKALLESGGSRYSIRQATKEGKRQAKYNKMLAESQNSYNKKFSKVSDKIARQRKEGLNPSSKDIKKAIKYGTEVRKADYMAKDPKQYYKNMRSVERSAFWLGLMGGTVSAINANRKNNKYYAKAFEKARNETIEDLKKRKLI